MMPDDLFANAAREKLLAAGWSQRGGFIAGLLAWTSPDGNRLLSEAEALAEVERAERESSA